MLSLRRGESSRARPTQLQLVVALLGAVLAACAVSTGRPAPIAPQDGPVFEGSAPAIPGSSAKLVLEKDYRQTRMLRWQSNDTRIGAAEVDFFQPRDWQLQGDPPHTLTFSDRSPGPILFGEVRLSPPNRAVVSVVLGGARVTYLLDRIEGDGTP